VKLVTYDREGHGRLGAVLGEWVIDLPEAVGHPVFPATMEALIGTHGGTVLDAARDALSREDLPEFIVKDAPIASPLSPTSLRVVGTDGRYQTRNHRSVLGQEEVLAWPPYARQLDFEVSVACVVGRGGTDLTPEEAEAGIFGFVLMNDWVLRDEERRERAARAPPGRSRDFATSLGPVVVTPDEVAGCPRITVAVDGELRTEREASPDGFLPFFGRIVAQLSLGQEVWPGDVVAAPGLSGGCRDDTSRCLKPRSNVEADGGPLGMLRNRVGPLPARRARS